MSAQRSKEKITGGTLRRYYTISCNVLDSSKFESQYSTRNHRVRAQL